MSTTTRSATIVARKGTPQKNADSVSPRNPKEAKEAKAAKPRKSAPTANRKENFDLTAQLSGVKYSETAHIRFRGTKGKAWKI